VLGQEHCRRQADQAAARKQDWNFPVDHRSASPDHHSAASSLGVFFGRFYDLASCVNLDLGQS
jgi:hypothetical protein